MRPLNTSLADEFMERALVVPVPFDMVNVPNFGDGDMETLFVMLSMSVIDMTGSGALTKDSE